MTEQPTATGMTTTTESTAVRIGDAERERAVTELGEHFAAGRLTPDELDERLGKAWAARTAGDLQPLFTDLPGGRGAARPARSTQSVARRSGGPGAGFPWPLLFVVAIVLTVTTRIPFILFFFGLIIMTRFFGAGYRRQQYAIRR